MILDTHAWLRFLGGNLGKTPRRRIERAREARRLQIAAVTLWEIALLVQERRLRVDGGTAEWLDTALVRSGVGVAPLDAPAAAHAASLIRVLRDPADCQIAGTALSLGVPLATRDTRILDAAAGLRLDVVEV